MAWQIGLLAFLYFYSAPAHEMVNKGQADAVHAANVMTIYSISTASLFCKFL